MSLYGIINVNKPKGLTSHDVVARLRKILNTKKIGHTGTLDPFATGVLPICIGKATKLIQYLETSKIYRAYVLLGVKTDSYDSEGKIIEQNPVSVDMEKINEVLNLFKGEITQKPPIFSAVHYKGKRLYEYARANIEIEDIPERKIFVEKLDFIEIQNLESNNPILVLDISCSGGTYIRSIANDIGEKLGFGASLIDLTRLKAGSFCLENSFTLEEIENLFKNNKQENFLINPLDLIALNSLNISEEEILKIKYGQFLINKNNFFENEKIKLIYNNTLIAIAKIEEEKIKPVCVFV